MPTVSVSDFDRVKLIGSGHFGFVFLAKEISTNSFYALKQVDKLKYLRNNNVEHLFVERDIMARATSQWLVKLQYSFYDANAAYFVMDFLPGGDLMQLLLRSNDFFDEKTAKFYLAETCQAINALHSLSYVHRDVKPENLFLDFHGHICLGDFGSAAKLSPDGNVSAKMVVGTPEYVSPEVLLSIEQKAANSYGVECDWWSFGVLAFEMVYGCTPFEDDSQMALFNKIMNYDKYFRFPDSAESTSGEKPVTVSADMKQLIRHLLTAPNKRLTYSQIRAHPFFAGLNFDRLRSMKPPFLPQLSGPEDTRYFPAPSQQQQKPKSDQPSPRKSEVVSVSPDSQTMAGFNFVRTETKQYKTPAVTVKKERKEESGQGDTGENDADLAEFNRDCSNMLRRLQENDRMICALREEITQRVSLFEQVQLQRDMLERDVTKQMAENALLTRQVALQRRELENLERAVRSQLTDVRRQLQVRSASGFCQSMPATPAHTQTEDNGIDVESLLEQLSTLREQVESLSDEKGALTEQLKRAESMAKDRAQQATLQRQSSMRDLEGQVSRLRAAEAESRELRRKLDDLRSEHASHDRKTGSELASCKSEITRLEVELADARERAQTITGLRSRLADAETKVVLLEQRLQRTSAKLDERERQMREKESARTNDALKISTGVGTSPLSQPDRSPSYKQRFEALEKEGEAKIGELTKQVTAAERSREDSKAMAAKLRKALTETETELETSRRHCEKLRQDQGIAERDLRRELESLRLELIAAKEQASEAQKTLTAERKSRDSLSKELIEARRKLNESQGRSASLEKEISDIAHEIGQIEILAAKERKVLDKEREKRMAAERELDELRQSSTANQKSEASWKTALTSNLEEARRRNDELTVELKRLNAAKVSAECDLKASKANFSELESQIKQLKARLAEATEKLSASENLREDLASRLGRLAEDHETLQRQLAETEAAHNIERFRLETTIHQQIKLIDYIQSKPPQTPSKSQSNSQQNQSENRPPPVFRSALKSSSSSSSKRHEAVPLTGVKFPESSEFPPARSVPLADSNYTAEQYRAVTPPNNSAVSATTSLLALGPHRSNLN